MSSFITKSKVLRNMEWLSYLDKSTFSFALYAAFAVNYPELHWRCCCDLEQRLRHCAALGSAISASGPVGKHGIFNLKSSWQTELLNTYQTYIKYLSLYPTMYFNLSFWLKPQLSKWSSDQAYFCRDGRFLRYLYDSFFEGSEITNLCF